jgi:hypothetical protein
MQGKFIPLKIIETGVLRLTNIFISQALKHRSIQRDDCIKIAAKKLQAGAHAAVA